MRKEYLNSFLLHFTSNSGCVLFTCKIPYVISSVQFPDLGQKQVDISLVLFYGQAHMG